MKLGDPTILKNCIKKTFGGKLYELLSLSKHILTDSLIAIKNFFTQAEKRWLVLGLAKDILCSKENLGFFGWHMYAPVSPPWTGDGKIFQQFNQVNNHLLELIKAKKLKLMRFWPPYSLEFRINTFKWRHYNVFWSVKYAIQMNESSAKNFVEFGVGDGNAAYYAMQSLTLEKVNDPKFYLYDSWGPMQGRFLLNDEKKKGLEGRYDFLCINDTKANLKEFENITVFNQGYLPESIPFSENPDDISWMHIDINSAIPTREILEFFYDKLSKRGVILFDDYAWKMHKSTRKTVDDFFSNKKGLLFPLPTGQAIYFNSGC